MEEEEVTDVYRPQQIGQLSGDEMLPMGENGTEAAASILEGSEEVEGSSEAGTAEEAAVEIVREIDDSQFQGSPEALTIAGAEGGGEEGAARAALEDESSAGAVEEEGGAVEMEAPTLALEEEASATALGKEDGAVDEEPPTVPLEEEAPTVPLEEEAPTVPLGEDAPAMTWQEDAPAMGLEEEAPAMALEEVAPVMAWQEEAPDMALEEEAPDMALEEEAPIMARQEEAPSMPLEEDAPAMPLEEDAPAIPLEEEAAAMPLEEEAPVMAWQEEAPAMALEEVAPVMAWQEEPAAMPLEEEVPVMAWQEEAPAMALEEVAPVMAWQEEVAPVMALEEEEAPVMALEEVAPVMAWQEEAAAVQEEASTVAVQEDASVQTTQEDASVQTTQEEASSKVVEEDASAMVLEEDASAVNLEEEASAVALEEEASAVAVAEDASVLAADEDAMNEESYSVSDTVGRAGGKRKRGRPSRVQVTRPLTRRKEEEDVCFICFDGGDLVVCDRRGCPKVYHPSCVNRDEAFFRSRGRWNCGWHICSICEKAAKYMCYTCTYSLCKGCIKEAGFVCVRGNKGFCETCRSTVMLIETKEQAKEKTAGVDFDDKNSWEYLFKDYWLDLKRKLSISFEELTMAKNPWKGSIVRNEESSDELYNANDEPGSSSDSSPRFQEGSNSAKKKMRRRSKTTVAEEGSKDSVKLVVSEGTSVVEDCEWASKELLEFVMHMKNGDKSVLSQFDVQALLLEYIKQKNLRDPRRKSQIICDPRLENLFGKARVGHFEMLKLLESHFLIKEASQVTSDDNQGGLVDPESSKIDPEGNSDMVPKTSSEKKRKNRRRIEERELQTNVDDFAAIDVHNISLIYLRRNLMEDFLDDIEQFNDKVVGSFVRIRISGTGQRQDMYRLVQVVGTSKAPETYKTGKKTTDISLEILNLNKKEILPIDSISNQEFTEEECRRLRQSIKCGLISRLTVGEIQEKAKVLQAVRVNDWLESEKLRLGHLRDRASEKGRRKELRECVEKLQLLSTPEERSRRFREIPEVHTDPKMDPSYESAEEESEDKKLENYNRPRDTGYMRKGRELGKGGLSAKDSWNGARKVSTTRELSRNTSTKGAWDKGDASASAIDRTGELAWNQVKDMQQPSSWETPKHQANATGLDTGAWSNSQPATKPVQASGVSPEATGTSLSAGIAISSTTNEAEKIWHYKDPAGKIQGPFSMTQLRKWNTTGYFPIDLRIWRTSEKQEDSVLLTDALEGKFQKVTEREFQHNSTSQIQRVVGVTDGRENNREGDWRGNNNSTWTERKQNIGDWKLGNNDSSFTPGSNGPKDINAWSHQPQTHNGTIPLAPFSGKPYQPPSHQITGGQDGNFGRWNGGQDHGNMWTPNKLTVHQSSGPGYERHSRWDSPGQKPSGGLSKVQPANDPSNQWVNDSYNLPTPTPQPSSVGWKGGHPTNTGWGTSPNPRGSGVHQSPIGTNESNKWVEQPHASTQQSVGRWDSNPSSHGSVEMANTPGPPPPVTVFVDKATKVAEGFNSTQILDKADTSHESHTSTQQRLPSEPDGSILFTNHSDNEVPLKDRRNSPNTGRVLGGLASTETRGEFDNSPTPKDDQTKIDTLSSERRQPVPSPISETQELRAHHVPDTENMAPLGASRTLDVASNHVSPTVASHLSGLISPINEFAAGSHGLESRSAQRQGVSSPGFQGGASVSFPKQDPGGSNLKPSLPGGGWGEPILSAPDHAGNRSAQADPKSNEWSMPSPTPTIKPSAWDAGSETTSGNNQLILPEGSKPPSSSVQWSTPLQGNQITGPAQVSTNTGWGMPIQGSPNMVWGPMVQGNATPGWGTPLQGNPNLNMGWVPPAQGSAIPNTSWRPPAQGTANVNVPWGPTAPGNMNPNIVWAPQGNVIPNPGWVAPVQENPNPGWGVMAQGTVNPNPGWGAPPAQGNANVNVNANASLGMGNVNANANMGNWGSQQKHDGGGGERYSGHGEQGGSQGNESGHGGGRQGWNRMQQSSGGGSSRNRGICRFHENGHCKKGSSCGYLHT